MSGEIVGVFCLVSQESVLGSHILQCNQQMWVSCIKIGLRELILWIINNELVAICPNDDSPCFSLPLGEFVFNGPVTFLYIHGHRASWVYVNSQGFRVLCVARHVAAAVISFCTRFLSKYLYCFLLHSKVSKQSNIGMHNCTNISFSL